jgi:glyoxylase-like metal-dependent hydrolase (beta-lactamase superfamily II)
MNQALVDQRQESAFGERELYNNVYLVAPGVWRLKDIFVNMYLIQDPDADSWILVDTGLKTSAHKIKKMIGEVLDPGSVPKAIVLTHGHFDHVGSLRALTDEWNTTVYAHKLEMPYLTGKASYPPPDPNAGGGLLSTFSFAFPKGPIDVHDHIQELPDDGSVPGIPGWKWIHTPGHAPGHISLFREKDGVLVAGDAFVTTKQESIFSVMAQKRQICGPPKYFTPDWGSAARSVKALAALEPNVVTTGHGHALYGNDARHGLHKLAREFWQLGMPGTGRYVNEPAQFNEDGPTYIPKKKGGLLLRLLAAGALLAAGIYLYKRRQKKLGATLMTSSLQVLTGAAPAAATTAASSPMAAIAPILGL